MYRRRDREPLEAALRGARGVIAAHAVHASAGRRRCRAQKHAWIRRGVRIPAGDRAGEQLAQIGDASGDRTADVIGVLALEIARCRDVPRKDAVPEAGSESLDLSFDVSCEIDSRSSGYV